MTNKLLACASVVLAVSTGASHAADPAAIGSPVAMTVYLPLKNQAAAEAEAVALQTPGSAAYHHFLTVPEFVSRYAVSNTDIAALEAVLKLAGFTTVYEFRNHLAIQVTGSASAAAALLGTTLHTVTRNGVTGLIPSGAVKPAAALNGMVLGIGGLDTVDHARPHFVRQPDIATAPATLTGGTPGNYLPATFEADYDVNPLYTQHLTGRGRTIGIVTLNSFQAPDAYSFWSQIGLTVDQTRITKINVDGGLTASTNNAGGEAETDIDVEESGSVAPDAKIRVYVAPNLTNQNFIDDFEAAASENIADTISSSWGQPELLYFATLAGAPDLTWQLQAFHLAFLEMALQGQTIFIAAGDSGSYDTVEDPCDVYGTPSAKNPICNAPYAVDHPGSDPLVTAAGGTTLAFSAPYKSVTFSVPAEQAWGWRYLVTEAAAQGHPKVFTRPDAFSVGGGGGVSSYWPLPWYQAGTAGIQLTEPGQTYTQNTGAGPVLLNVLPAGFAGRNMPDLSTDADPFSGYQFIEKGKVQAGYGGTSFVAPQLNGVNALFEQALGRTGQLNPALYLLRQESRDIARGNNWGYKSVSGYDTATGVGALDAAKLLDGLTQLANQ